MRISSTEFLQSSLAQILQQEGNVNQLNQEISSGQAISSAIQDPGGAGLALGISGQIDRLTFDTNNANSGVQSLQGGIGILQQVTTLINQMSNTAAQAANGTISDSDRQALVGVVQGAIQQLVQLANAQGSNGDYMFAGSQTATRPFQMQANGQVLFMGDNGQSSIEIAPGLTVPVNASGQSIFMNIPNGNGTFGVNAVAANQGTAYATPIGVTSANQVAAEHLANTQFQITFGAIQPDGTTAYTVTSGTGTPGSPGFIASSGVVSTGAYNNGGTLNFGGLSVQFSGAPATGDQFNVNTSQNTSVFQILSNLASALTAPRQGTGAAALAQQQVENVIGELSNASTNLLSAQATLGANLSEMQGIVSQNNNAQTDAKAQLSNIQSINLPQVMTNYNESVLSLQAAQEAFSKIQGLTLFSLIH